MTTQAEQAEAGKSRRQWPPEMAWPTPPAPYHAFSLTLFEHWPKGTPVSERPRPFYARLYHLSPEQFEWVRQTVEVEARRRTIRNAPDPSEVPA